MLSRSAKHLYWLARYIERCENIARMVDVNLELILDFPIDHSLNWKSLIDTLDINYIFEKKYQKYNEENVINFLFEGRTNYSSMQNCLNMAKFNIENVRDDLPKTSSIALNHLHDHLHNESISKIHKRKILPHVTETINLTQEFFSSINDNLSRGYEFEFIRLGRFLERVDMISRIIDCLCITKSEKQTYDFSSMEWISLLSILSAQDAFRKISKGEVDRGEVINFLLKNDSFPRSLTRCLSILRLCLESLPNNEKIILKIRSLRLRFDESTFDQFNDDKLHVFLDKCQKDLISIDNLVEKTYF
tara:strand:+ start:177 stop:1088 length:912 start_codon:yes stop_codon:yes gene_type:complete